jgi:hypothetical protein
MSEGAPEAVQSTWEETMKEKRTERKSGRWMMFDGGECEGCECIERVLWYHL